MLTYFLSGSVPDVEFDGSTVRVEDEGVDFNTQGGHIFLLELSRQVTLDESSLSDTTVTDKDELELGNVFLSLHWARGMKEPEEKPKSKQKPS